MTRTMKRHKPVTRSNIPMILMMFALVVFGLVILYSVSGPAGYAKSGEDKSTLYYMKSQILYTVLGIAACLFISFKIPISFFKRKIVWGGCYVVSLVLVILTELVGTELNGAQRWLSIGGMTFQTSELVKVALVIALAGYRQFIVDKRARGELKPKNPKSIHLFNTFFDFVLPVSAAALVDVLILVQPHFSCFLIIAFMVFMCTLNSGVNIKSWIGGIMILLPIAVGATAITLFLQPKMMERFQHVVTRINVYSATSTGDDSDVSEDDMRQVTNAHNALGSGGLWGRGIGNSRAKYNYVSEAQNDYIFSIYVEETGFMGGLLLISMYLIMFAMCAVVIIRADSVFSRMIATGCTSHIIIQVLLNLGVELQVLPSTGVTLPFVSFGGTAQVFLLISYGMILCVSKTGTVQKYVTEKKDEA